MTQKTATAKTPGRPRIHHYAATTVWTGNRGTGTSGYTHYGREHDIVAPGRPVLPGSSDPAFRGDATRYNPEDLMVASVSACHMLWYLHLCAEAGIVVTAYRDEAEGTMTEAPGGGGRFTEIVLRPQVTVSKGDADKALALHAAAHEKCYIANSVNFPVVHRPTVAEG